MFHRVSLTVYRKAVAWISSCCREWFWGYMQRHWEDDLHAGAALTFSGDEIPAGESAVVISVSYTSKGTKLKRTESSGILRLLPHPISRPTGGYAWRMSLFRKEGARMADPHLRLGLLGMSSNCWRFQVEQLTGT